MADIHSGISVILIDAAGDNLISVALVQQPAMAGTYRSGHRGHRLGRGAGLPVGRPAADHRLALRRAKELGVTTILDPAPATPLPDEVYQNTDIITPNESETQTLTGILPETLRSASQAGRTLLARGVRIAIIKLGERDCLCVTPQGEHYVPAVHVHAVDVTGAGDAFAGGLMVAMAEGKR